MNKPDFSKLNVLFANCSLKKSKETSHTAGIWQLVETILDNEQVNHKQLRISDYDLPPGVQPDMREDGFETDEWPALYETIMDADILIIGTPIWLGERSSVCSRFIERMYAMSAKQNEKGQYEGYGKVGGVLVSGNEDGIKHCAQSVLYALQHLGYSIPPQADAGWVGEVGPGPSYLDDESDAQENDFTNRNVTFMTYNLLHLASMLQANNGYPAYGNLPGEWEDGKKWGFENPEYR